MRKSFVKAVVLATSALSATAHAQVAAATQQPAAGAGADNSVGTGDIVVTARKRAENLRNVPVAITAVSAASAVATVASVNIRSRRKTPLRPKR